MGEAQAQIAGRDRADEFGPPLGTRRVPQQRAAQNHGLKIGLERQRLAEFLHHDHRFDRAAAEAAVFLRERRAEQAHLGVFAPELVAETVRARLIGLAVLEAVTGLHQPRDIVAQQFLFAAEVEIHGAQSPRMALAMMPRWISFDPP